MPDRSSDSMMFIKFSSNEYIMGLRQKYGITALIAGASEGIGAAFAEYLAAGGMDLVLIARRADPLEKLAQHLKNKYGTEVVCIPCDLASPEAVDMIGEALGGREVDLLVYNAALSAIGPFTGNSPEYLTHATQVNMITPLRMVHLFGGRMVARRKGAIILMASMAGLQGSGYLSVYAATKAFNRVLAESLWYEWKEYGVDVIACVAGATATPGYISSEPGKKIPLAPRVLNPEEIPQECLRRLGHQPSFITGRGNRIASFFMQKILPVKAAVKIMGDNTRKMYGV
jgi:short-subunit dehydrogenase